MLFHFKLQQICDAIHQSFSAFSARDRSLQKLVAPILVYISNCLQASQFARGRKYSEERATSNDSWRVVLAVLIASYPLPQQFSTIQSDSNVCTIERSHPADLWRNFNSKLRWFGAQPQLYF